MKNAIKINSFILTLCVLLFSCLAPAYAAGLAVYQNNDDMSDISVKIISPDKISSKPIYEGDIEIQVINESKNTLDNLDCYLTIVDVDRKQTYPVDEFGENAYQTRALSLDPGATATVKIPVRILYVGNFRFTASVIDYSSGKIYSGKALDVNILTDSQMNKTLVMIVAAAVPVAAIAVTAVIGAKRKSKKI